ncbi:hypothetical protein FB459_1871 [Yimella lutea]|uniref:Uncharacterized protein n=2 Tax=Yimella lutea TaxID=587872 RepID=A0A542EGE3_9MICO|nr:hypothetical protein FB459_1871 [Yimella lutea]
MAAECFPLMAGDRAQTLETNGATHWTSHRSDMPLEQTLDAALAADLALAERATGRLRRIRQHRIGQTAQTIVLLRIFNIEHYIAWVHTTRDAIKAGVLSELELTQAAAHRFRWRRDLHLGLAVLSTDVSYGESTGK